MQGEISHLQNQLTASANERDELLTQTQTLQQILNQKEVRRDIWKLHVPVQVLPMYGLINSSIQLDVLTYN